MIALQQCRISLQLSKTDKIEPEHARTLTLGEDITAPPFNL
ncbi:hypothetical protein Z949_2843 [Sulfitobacter guttiformis KCTC 32187]|nr:hypothetical protein Z949_2843 [Sulfitobacter guttiformis KCTC 32187]